MPKLLRLPCKLTDQEKLIVGGNLSAALTALDAARAAKKSAMEAHKEKIDDLETSIHTINVSLSTGTCEREVEVEDRKDPETGVSTCYRLDTNEPVNTRSLDPEERQLTIGQAPGPAPAETLGADAAGRTEEQNAAGSPEEAEAMRDTRIAEEKATQAFDSLATGADVEILIGEEWIRFAVENKTEYSFEANNRVYDVSKHGISWRLKPTWNDLVAASEEAARLAEIDRLAAEQAADKPPALLKAPRKKNGEPKSISVQDEKGNPIVPPAETPPSDDHPANGTDDSGLVF